MNSITKGFTDVEVETLKAISDRYADRSPKGSMEWRMLQQGVNRAFTPEMGQRLLHEVIRLRAQEPK
jgi:hypothetical protein